jgi:hypothetical protein
MTKIRNGKKNPALILAVWAVPEGAQVRTETEAARSPPVIVQEILNYQIEKHGFYISPL